MLGSPIGHSLSPVLHRAAYAALGLTGWRYDALECDEAAFATTLAGFDDDVVGLSCTMPLKHAALAAAASVSDTARAVGAANTLLRTAAGWHADNTDVDGVLGALAEAGVDGAPESVVVLGAGGTAQAVVVALARLGVDAVTVAVRDPARTGAFVATAAGVGIAVRVATLDAAPDATLVVSTLPGDAAAPVAGRLDAQVRVLLDVVYAPWPTTLARTAAAAGAAVVGGRSVLVHQAVRQVELMTGRSVSPAVLFAALGT